jgi:hypothetical protein
MSNVTNHVHDALAVIGIDDAVILDMRSVKRGEAYEWLCYDFDSEEHYAVRVFVNDNTSIGLANMDEVTEDGLWLQS